MLSSNNSLLFRKKIIINLINTHAPAPQNLFEQKCFTLYEHFFNYHDNIEKRKSLLAEIKKKKLSANNLFMPFRPGYSLQSEMLVLYTGLYSIIYTRL